MRVITEITTGSVILNKMANRNNLKEILDAIEKRYPCHVTANCNFNNNMNNNNNNEPGSSTGGGFGTIVGGGLIYN